MQTNVDGMSGESTCERELAEARASLQRAEAQLAVRDRERDELNHRVSNSLQLAASFLNIQLRRLEDGAASDALTAACCRIAAIARIHRHLADQGAASAVNLGRYLGELGVDIASSTGLLCEVEADPIEVSGDLAMRLAILVNELAINAKKHAYADEENGTIRVRCRREPDGSVRLAVTDRGRGLPDGFDVDAGHGLGMSLVSGIVRQLGGVLEAANADGACFTVHLPPLRLT